MKKTVYMKPLIEVIKVNSEALMEKWSVGIDNDPDHGIKPGEENDIGAKEGWFFNEEMSSYNSWED